MRLVFLFLLLLSPNLIKHSFAQSAENVSFLMKDGHVEISYDLIGIVNRDLYVVSVYGSHNDFSSPLIFVTGDVGKNVRPGKRKKIDWELAKEAPGFNGDITFRFSIDWVLTTTVLPITFSNPSGGSIRKGRAIIIEWQGGIYGPEKTLELYKGTKLIATVGSTTIREVTWTLPDSIRKGRHYQFRLTGPNENATSPFFHIRAKTPLLLKLSPLLVAAAVIPFINGSKSSKADSLPGAPLPE